MQRGLVNPARTTLIASSHREFATLEKVAPGNGVADGAAVLEAASRHARRFLHEDMQRLARSHGSVISAALFGALAGAGELPFSDAAYEDTIQRAGVSVEASLRAWRAACEAMRSPIRSEPVSDPMQTEPLPLPARAASEAVEALRARVVGEFPAAAHPMLGAGLQRLLEYQDCDYAGEYLDRVSRIHRLSQDAGRAQAPLATLEAARWIAVAMSYDDIIRVADLKSRPERFDRIRAEVGAEANAVVGTLEYFHPRVDEVCSLLPRSLGLRLEASAALRARLERWLAQGRRVRSHTLTGQVMLHALAGLRRWRRGSLRHHREQAHLERWLGLVTEALQVDYDLGVEVLRCRRLIKGYSDTHTRGLGKFDRLMAAARQLLGQPDAARRLAALREAALADAQGRALEQQWQSMGLTRE